jgi:hypothetical protein
MWKTTLDNRSDAAKLHVLTLCTGEGARYWTIRKNAVVTKSGTHIFVFVILISISFWNVLHRNH